MIKLLVATFLTGGIFVFAALGQDTQDNQFWNLNTIDFEISKDNDVRGLILTDARLVDNVSELRDLRVGFGVKKKVTDNWTVTPIYMYRRDRVSGASDVNEHHFIFDVEGKKNFEKASYDNRSRFEHRARDNGRTDLTFYRNRSRVKIPVKSSGETVITPFVANDTWFEIQEGDLFRNDLQVGFDRRFSKKLNASFYYGYRRDFLGAGKNQNIIGVNLGITLN